MLSNSDPSKWPKCGILLLGNEPANHLPPEGVVVHEWTSFVADGRASETAIEIADDPFALNTLIYTSGTTGNPKGVMLTNWNTLSNILCVQSAFKVYVGDKNAAFLPWAHSFGSTFDLHWCQISPVSLMNVRKLSQPFFWLSHVYGTSSTTVSTLNSNPQDSSECSPRKPVRLL